MEWQPIGDKPDEAMEPWSSGAVLLFVPGEHGPDDDAITTGFWEPNGMHFTEQPEVVKTFQESDMGAWFLTPSCGLFPVAGRPSHWMPLPPPPTSPS